MTPTLGYLLALLAITFVIDFTLRALPFKILEPLRDSRFVSDMAVWMPPGIMLILVLSTLTQGAAGGRRWWRRASPSLCTCSLVASSCGASASERCATWRCSTGSDEIALTNWLSPAGSELAGPGRGRHTRTLTR